jgi:hypothetical protein
MLVCEYHQEYLLLDDMAPAEMYQQIGYLQIKLEQLKNKPIYSDPR